jgi:predicted RNase H-like nuclease
MCHSDAMRFAGADGCKGGWVVVVIDDAGFVGSFVAVDAEKAHELARPTAAVVFDIPIGIPDGGPRQADIMARKFIQPRGPSVFPTPVRPALESASYPEAALASVLAQGKSLSTQAYAIRDKILDVDAFVRSGVADVFEGHPEVSFRAMADAGIEYPKKSFAGMSLRHRLLAAEGIVVPMGLEKTLPGASVDDVLDAAAMAWTARRIALGHANRFPSVESAEVFSDGIDSAIWF